MSRRGMERWLAVAGVVTLGASFAGCGGAKPAPVAAPKAAAQESAPPPPQAEAKFVDFSKELEKLGTDETVAPDHLRQLLRDVLAIDKAYRPARFNLAVLDELTGQRDKAEPVYQKLAQEDALFAPAVENITAETVNGPDLDKAVATYKGLIEHYPKNQTSRLALARIYLSQQKYAEAIDLCRQVLARQGDAIEAFRVLAQSYNATNNVPMAELIIARGLKVNKEDPELHHLLAQIFLDRDDLPNGMAKLKQVVRLDPNRLTVRAQLADIAASYRDFGNAAQQYEAIVKASPNLAPAHIDLGVSYKGLGRYDQAEKEYKDALTQQPDNADALWDLGVLYHRHLNRYDDAIAAFTKFKGASAANPNQVAQVDGLVADITKLKTDQQAQREREERERKKQEAIQAACADVTAGKQPNGAAIGNDQERAEVAWQLMANAQQVIQSGDVPTGEAAVKCAFAIIPDTPAAATGACAPMRVAWTQILYQLGRVDDAMTSIKAALKCDPNNPDAQLIQQQLKELAAQQPPPGAAAAPDAAAPAQGQAAPAPAPAAPAPQPATK